MHPLFAVLLALTQQWLLVSDLHVDPFDRSAQPAAYQEDTNWVLFDSALAQMRKSAPDPAVVVIDGDFLAHEFGSKVRAAGSKLGVQGEALHTMARIEAAFSKTYPRAQFLIALGNNDDPCGDYRTAPSSPYLRQLARIWAPLVDRGGTAPAFLRDFARAGSYTVRLRGGMRAIVVDDVPWSLFYRGCGRGGGALTNAQMNWFTRQLASVPQGVHSVVILHIPAGIDASSTLLAQRFLVVPFLRGDMAARLTAALNKYKQQVTFVIAGHTHRSDFRIFGGVPVIVAAAISPVYSNNPAFLTLAVAGDGTLRDYSMYADNLYDDAWTRVMDFDRTYAAGTFATNNLAALHARIPNDPDLREQWEAALTGYSPAKDVHPVWRAFWCAQTELRAGYAECAGDQRRVIALDIAIALFALGVVLAAVLIARRLARQRAAR